MKKVLVVEDDDAVFFVLSSLLQEKHYSVIGAQSIQYCNNVLRSEQVDCIVMDLGLRDGRSTSFIQQMHNSTDLLHIPLVVHTAGFNCPHERQRLAREADRVILTGRFSPIEVDNAAQGRSIGGSIAIRSRENGQPKASVGKQRHGGMRCIQRSAGSPKNQICRRKLGVDRSGDG